MTSKAIIIGHAFVCCLLALNGCGGGSSGTGLPLDPNDRIILGTVENKAEEPLAGVTVTVDGTTDSTTTAEDGTFQISTTYSGEQVPVSLTSEDVNTVVSISAPDDSNRIKVTLQVDLESGGVAVAQIDAKATIVGSCDIFFENGPIIRQAAAIPTESTCTAQIAVHGDGELLGGVKVAIQHKPCKGAQPWQTSSVSATATSGSRKGIARVDFAYFDDSDHCEYRIVVPFKDPAHDPLFFPIYTFRKQSYELNK